MSQYVQVGYSEAEWDNQLAQIDAWLASPQGNQTLYQQLKAALDVVKGIVDEMRRQVVFNCVTLAIWNLLAGLPMPDCLNELSELQ